MQYIEINKNGESLGTLRTEFYSYQIAEFLKEFKPTTNKKFIIDFVWFVMNKDNSNKFIDVFYVDDLIDITKL